MLMTAHYREDCLKHQLRRRLPFILCCIFLFGLAAGCKTTGHTTATPTATKTTVQITLQNAQFSVNEPLGVLIKNTGSTDVYAMDGKASCTIIELQQYVTETKSWVPVDLCRDNTPPQVLVIRAGTSEPFTLAPVSAGDPNSWASGIYRIALTFSSSTDGTSSATVAYSQGFTIQGS